MTDNEKASPGIPGAAHAGYSFAGFRLEPDGTLFRGRTVVHLPPKELAALELLLSHAGQVVTTQQLRTELWGDAHVTPDSILKCISSLRVRLEPEDCIQTVYKRGYRLSAEVRRREVREAETMPRLAILPFESAVGFPEHLAPAVMDGITSRLVNMRPALVAVLAADSVASLVRRELTAPEIGHALKADLVLRGMLHALPAYYRLRAEMIRVEDGTQLWVEDLLMEQTLIGGMEEELVNRLLFRLGAPAAAEVGHTPPFSVSRSPEPPAEGSVSHKRLNGGGLTLAAAADTPLEDADAARKREAYDTYLKARHKWHSLERHRMQDGLHELLRVIEADPSLVSAQVDLANLCVAQALYGFMSPTEAAGYVRGAAESIAARDGEAVLPALGWVQFHVDHNLRAALDAFSGSSQRGRDPHDPWITRLRIMFALSRHRFDEAIALVRDAMRDDPYSAHLHNRLAWALHLAGRPRESVEQVKQALALFPDHEGTSFFGSMIFAFNGDPERGVELAQKLAALKPHYDLAAVTHGYALACTGRHAEARGIVERLQWLSRERFAISSFTAALHLELGEHDAAVEALRTADRNRCPWFFQVLADPRLKPLHGDSRFEEMRLTLPRMEAEAAEA